jgi:hypothetical protein
VVELSGGKTTVVLAKAGTQGYEVDDFDFFLEE